MKKIFGIKKILSIGLIILILSLCGCGGASEGITLSIAPKNNIITADSADAYLRQFLNISTEKPDGDLGDRESFSKSEEACAQNIKAFAESLLVNEMPAYSVKTVKFTVSEETSQNVIVLKKSKNEGAKQVIIGTYYDNTVAVNSLNQTTEITKSVGAMENGTGCAMMYALMDYYKDSDLPFDLVFAFFGATNSNNAGAQKYVDEMTVTERNNTLLMISLHRYGGKNLYLYSEETKTEHQEFIKTSAKAVDVDLKEVPVYLPVISAYSFKRLPYATWATNSVHAPFMEHHINVANIYSADYNFLSVMDDEYIGQANRSNTITDTYSNLVKDYPLYGAQICDTANVIIATLSDSGFESAMISSRQNFKSYDFFTYDLYANLVLLGLIMILGLIVFLLIKKFEKKYPYKPKKINYKLAVFGTDYEDKNDTDVFIDIKKPDVPQDPFS